MSYMAVQFNCFNQQQEDIELERNHDFHKGTANITVTGKQ